MIAHTGHTLLVLVIIRKIIYSRYVNIIFLYIKWIIGIYIDLLKWSVDSGIQLKLIVNIYWKLWCGGASQSKIRSVFFLSPYNIIKYTIYTLTKHRWLNALYLMCILIITMVSASRILLVIILLLLLQLVYYILIFRQYLGVKYSNICLYTARYTRNCTKYLRHRHIVVHYKYPSTKIMINSQHLYNI